MFWKWPSPWWSCYGWWRRPLFSVLPKLAYSRTGKGGRSNVFNLTLMNKLMRIDRVSEWVSEWVIECHSNASKSPWHDYVIHELKTCLFAYGTRNLSWWLPLVRLSECWIKYSRLSISIRPWVSLYIISVNLNCLLLVTSVPSPGGTPKISWWGCAARFFKS